MFKNQFENKFYKVAENGGTYVVATLFNPITFEVKTAAIYDYDYYYPIVNEEYYHMDINKDALKIYNHFRGCFEVGDLVLIERGRNFKGEQKRVTKKFTYKVNSFVKVDYLVFEDGTKVNQDNCVLIKEYERLAKNIQDKINTNIGIFKEWLKVGLECKSNLFVDAYNEVMETNLKDTQKNHNLILNDGVFHNKVVIDNEGFIEQISYELKYKKFSFLED